jgi:succinate dehydrogenase / fumarate reductase membrane anchor subunit
MSRHDPFRNPLSTVRGLGSAKEGAGDWLAGRLTSLALIPLNLWFVGSVLTGALTLDTEGVRAWMAQPVTGLLMALMMGIIVHHSKHGIQVVLEDYVHGEGAKFIAIALNTGIHLLAAALSVFAIVKLHFLNG